MRGKTKRGRTIYADWSSQSPMDEICPFRIWSMIDHLPFLSSLSPLQSGLTERHCLFIDRQDT